MYVAVCIYIYIDVSLCSLIVCSCWYHDGYIVLFIPQSCANGRSDACVEIVCDIRAISRTIRATIQAIPDNRQFFVSTV